MDGWMDYKHLNIGYDIAFNNTCRGFVLDRFLYVYRACAIHVF